MTLRIYILGKEVKMKIKNWIGCLLLSCVFAGFSVDLGSAMIGIPSGAAVIVCFFGMMDRVMDY
jgi:hypothetical protein